LDWFIYVIVVFYVAFFASLLACRVSISRSALRVKSLTTLHDDGISLNKPVQVELGFLRARGYYSRGYHVTAEFTSTGSAFVSKIRYEDLCSDAYLLAVDERGIGYLIAPAAKINSRVGRNVIIACLDPSKTPKLSKTLEIAEPQTLVKSEIKVTDGRYLIKASWTVSGLKQWRVVYDEKKGVHTIISEPDTRSKARNAVVKLCVKPQTPLAGEFCVNALKIEKPGDEAVRELEGLKERKIIIEHLNNINLRKLSEHLGITNYPHISGYARESIKAKLILNIPLARDLVREEDL